MCILELFTKDQWITIISTITGIVASVIIAKIIFETEQNVKKQEEDALNKNEVKLLQKILEESLDTINTQINYIDDSIKYKSEVLIVCNDINYDYFTIINFNRIYQYKKDTDLLVLNDLLVSLKELSFMSNLLGENQSEFIKRKWDHFNNLDDIYVDILKLIIPKYPTPPEVVIAEITKDPTDVIFFYDEAKKILSPEIRKLKKQRLNLIDKHDYIVSNIINLLENVCSQYDNAEVIKIEFLLDNYSKVTEFYKLRLDLRLKELESSKTDLARIKKNILNFLDLQ